MRLTEDSSASDVFWLPDETLEVVFEGKVNAQVCRRLAEVSEHVVVEIKATPEQVVEISHYLEDAASLAPTDLPEIYELCPKRHLDSHPQEW